MNEGVGGVDVPKALFYRKCTTRQWLHAQLVIPFECILSGKSPVLKLPCVEVCYYFLYFSIQSFKACMDFFFQFLDQMCLEVFHVVFYGCFASRLVRWRRKDYGMVMTVHAGVRVEGYAGLV